jgi:hypothetical protein
MPRRELIDTFHRLWRHARARRQEILYFQTRKLRVLIHHAYRKVPYYRRMFDRCGIPPERIRQLDDLALLPITSSKHFRVQPTKSTSNPAANFESAGPWYRQIFRKMPVLKKIGITDYYQSHIFQMCWRHLQFSGAESGAGMMCYFQAFR